MATIDVIVNEEQHRVDVRDHWTLLDLLRDVLEMTGTKDGCSEGVCGACSVLVDGRLVRSCLTLARRVAGARITTVEGLARDGAQNDLQRAFAEQGAVQCGFCTPGMLVSITALLEAHPEPSSDEIREFLAGNLCRCTGYVRIFAAVRAAAEARARATAASHVPFQKLVDSAPGGAGGSSAEHAESHPATATRHEPRE